MNAPYSRRQFLRQLATAAGSIQPILAASGARRFDFRGPDTIAALLSPQNTQRIEYVGSATSHFQAEPLLYDEHGKARVFSDWEYEVTRRLRGEHSGIPHAEMNDLPRFLLKKNEYLGRSATLSENMFRFSLDFARLCPKGGEFNEDLMADYLRVLALIKAHGQEPFLTLHHFTMPRYLITTDGGGNITAGAWEHPDVVRHFRYFVSKVIAFLSQEARIGPILDNLKLDQDVQHRILRDGLVRYIMTINEPAVTLFNGYLSGTMPPYKHVNLLALRRVRSRLIEVHDLAFNEIRQGWQRLARQPQVCIGHNWQYFDGIIGGIAHEFQRDLTASFERDGQYSDFLALHYYFRRTLPLTSAAQRKRDYGDQPAFGDVYPTGILKVIDLMHASYPHKKIFIAEIGFSDRSDLRRPYWILETVRYIIEALGRGIPITGVLLWSLVNNFEWELGMSQKFGLFSESELSIPPSPSASGIRSWQAWQAATRAIRAPSPERLTELQRTYELAYAQYKQAGGRY